MPSTRTTPPEGFTRARFLGRLEAARESCRNFELRTRIQNKNSHQLTLRNRVDARTARVVLDKTGTKGHRCSCLDGARPFALAGTPPSSLCVHVLAAILISGDEAAASLLPYLLEADRRKPA